MDIDSKWEGFRLEILRIMHMHDLSAAGEVDDKKRLEIRRLENQALADACFRHKRELDLMAGLKVEPMAFEATATLFPVSGIGDGG